MAGGRLILTVPHARGSLSSIQVKRLLAAVIVLALGLHGAPAAAQYKSEFAMSLVPNEETP
jgi:hypothetical protein